MYAGRWAWGGLMLLLTNAANMSMPYLLSRAVNGIKRSGESAALSAASQVQLQRTALWLIGLALAGMVFRTLSRMFILYAARDVESDLRCKLYSHLTTLEPEFYAHHPTGDLMSRATNDLTQVRLMLGPGLLNIVNTAVAYAVAIPLMLMISVKLTLISLCAYPPVILLMRHLGRRLYAANKVQQQALGALTSHVQENLNGAFVVRAFAAEAFQEEKFAAVNAAYLQANLGLSWTRSAMFRVSATFASVGTLATVVCGGLDVISGALTLGDIVAFVEYMALLAGPTFVLGWIWSLWQRGAASMARMQEILDSRPEIISGALPQTQPAAGQGAADSHPHAPDSHPHAPLHPHLHRLQHPHPQLTAQLQVRDLTVTYGGRRSVDSVSFTVPTGTTLGIVGPIGGGKSVLVRALLRLVACGPGQIFVGDHDVTDLSLQQVRSMFGYVPQNPSLFSKTVAQNIAFGAPDSSTTSIVAAVEAAALSDDVARLPQGLDTEVGERGITLSGGQKQRCAIARALLLNPPILVLDDALSAVDTGTEVRILTALQRLRRGRTTLIVAHRLSAVQHAEHIVVLCAGKIVQQGTHQALLQQPGIYAQMAQQQASAAAEPSQQQVSAAVEPTQQQAAHLVDPAAAQAPDAEDTSGSES
jgi:ATP-binding cassette subfamily B multidrug efflux pump